MNGIYTYIYSLAVAAAAAGIAITLAPDNGTLKKYVKYAAALCVLIMMILPARGAVTETRKRKQYRVKQPCHK